MVKACLTVRLTSQAETKVGHSDPGVLSGKALDQRIKGTLGINPVSPNSSREEIAFLENSKISR
jgi:hypothetical protein